MTTTGPAIGFGADLSLTPGTDSFKADTVKQAAHLLVEHGIVSRKDLIGNHDDEMLAAWTSIPVLGDASWDYPLDRCGIER